MTTVLGLSITTTSIGWVLVDGSGVDDTLDHDSFDVNAEAGASQHAAAVRGAQAIAAASGHQVHSIGVTWSDDVEAEGKRLLESLADSDFENVVGVQLSQATQAWARDLGYAHPALCVIEPAAATVLTVRPDDGAVQTAATHSRNGAEGLSQWLAAVFDQNGGRPEGLFLVGSRKELEKVAGSLDAALPMKVFSSAEDQLALARGAALSLAPDEKPPSNKTTPSRSWFAHARAGTVVAASVGTVIALCAADTQLSAETDFKAAEGPPAADMSVPPASPPPVPALAPLAAPVPPPAPPVALPIGLPAPPPLPEVVADPSAYPAAVEPVEAAPEPTAPPAAPASSEPLAPPPAEASHLPSGPPPVAGPVPPPPPAPQQPPPAPQQPPPAPQQPPPPQDPLGVVLSPLFSALP